MITHKEIPNKPEEIDYILNPVVKKWFYSRFKEYSLPQLFGVMEIHSRNNILVSAPTGATKTLTSFMAILNELVDSSEKGILENKIYCVYVSPLKALSNDISINLIEPLKQMEEIAGKKFNIRVAVRTGDTSASDKAKMLQNPPHILITTPETLAIVLSSIKFKEYLKDVSWCIVDEIHALAENKRGVHLSLSLERLGYLASHMTRIGLSATVSPIDEIAKFLVGNNRDCLVVDVPFIKQMDLKVLSPVPDLVNVSYNELHNRLYELIHSLVQEHKTTLIFTNTRSATERVVHYLKDMFPKSYYENIGAHHGSLSAEHRRKLEQNLREGKLKAVVCSTSLELGIDIGYIDLVICLGSPKSVARTLQRIGRSGHQLHAKTKGRIIVLDRDDLMECSVLLKSALEKKLDNLHIPKNALDVLIQQLYGMAIEQEWGELELFNLIKQSYCYSGLSRADFNECLSYLSGEYASLEDRNVYAKIWRENGKIGRKGRMARVIYMTNIGTIPDQTGVQVKIGEHTIGVIDEGFLERLRRGDIFVLGGNTYMFKFSRGMVAQVEASVDKPPTVPSWVSEMLPLSFELANDIGRFRRLMEEKLQKKMPKKELIEFIDSYLYVDANSANAIYEYFYEQFSYCNEIPNDKKILVENYNDGKTSSIIFHALYGRRVNDVLSRAVAFAISRSQHRDVEIGINDNGFYINTYGKADAFRAFKLLNSDKLRMLMNIAIDNSEVFKRRFRHCACRALMILRSYKGRTKRVGRQQVSSMLLMSAVKRISPDFSILKEARREVLEDLMDIENARFVLWQIEQGNIKIKEINTKIPSPFSFNLVLQGYVDILKMEDKMDFLRKMHELVLAKISLGKNIDKDVLLKQKINYSDRFDYYNEWKRAYKEREANKNEKLEKLKFMAWNLERVPVYAKEEIVKMIDGEREDIRKDVIEAIDKRKDEIKKKWPKELVEFVLAAREEMR